MSWARVLWPASAAYGAFAIGFWTSGDALAPVRYGLYLLPFVTGLGLILTVLSVFLRRPAPAVIMAIASVGLLVPQLAALRQGTGPIQQTASDLVVVTASNRGLNRDMAATARFLNGLSADVLVLQEVSDASVLLSLLADGDTPMQACNYSDFIIASRFRVSGPETTSTNMTICTLALPEGAVRVIAVHLPKPLLSRTLQDDVTGKLIREITRSRIPVIVAGDFNATPFTSPIRRVEAHLQNAFRNAGRGLGLTFPTPARRLGTFGPFMQIDYIFHSDQFRTVSARALDRHAPMADHFPVRAVLRRLPEAGS